MAKFVGVICDGDFRFNLIRIEVDEVTPEAISEALEGTTNNIVYPEGVEITDNWIHIESDNGSQVGYLESDDDEARLRGYGNTLTF